jgi:benzil reductase ((S)-benzoin forming)
MRDQLRMKKLAIITGTSRGLGLNLANDLLGAGFAVVGIARSNSIKHPQFHFLKLDLSSTKDFSKPLEKFLSKKKISIKNESVVLINNAATVLPVNYFHKVKKDEIDLSYFLNLRAPLLMSHFVMNRFLAKTNQIIICNISSGAAVHALENWSMYCTMKSGLKMFTDCLNVDYASSGKLKAFSFYPGVMDTKMQQTIRRQPAKNFKNLDTFKNLKEKNALLDPKFVSQAILSLVIQPENIQSSEYDIKDFKGKIE